MARVLVVEDNAANMTLATFLLESAGHAVIGATDAETGLMLARQEQPDIVLMDIQLPGMDGLQATALLKQDEATRRIPVIALTANAMAGDREKALAAGCDDFDTKPIELPRLLGKIKALADRINCKGSSAEAEVQLHYDH